VRPLRLRPVTLVDEGDEVLVGDPTTGTFVAVPTIGAVVIRALQQGATVEAAAAEAERCAGEPVDVNSFVDALRELGFVDDQAADAEEGSQAPRRTAPIQQRRWIGGPLRRRGVGILFSPAAWWCYAAAFLFCVACFVVRPSLWPSASDFWVLTDHGLSAVVVPLLWCLHAALHEGWHWLAARSLGLQARFGVDRRLYFLVFETDLSQLWSVPRRQRYGPQLAGLAIDSVGLAVLLGVELLAEAGWIAPSAVFVRLVAALVFILVTGMLWQCMVFLRTDLYGVLVTGTGCRNLWEVKTLLLRKAFGKLSPEQAAELTVADPRDLRVGRWFRWVYLAGLLGALAYFAYFYMPVLLSLLAWSLDGLAVGPLRARFWLTAAASTLLYLPLLTVLCFWLVGLHRRLAARKRELRGSAP
jgi:hypothetical protein